MDIPQLILVGVVSLLTLMLLFLGFQVFMVLRDIRQSIKRVNKIVDEIGFQTTSEILKIIFTNQKRRYPTRKISQKEKIALNGQTNGEKNLAPSLQFQIKVPRFFKGLPKRR